MIQNLPAAFPIEALARFDFGDGEAQQDDLLLGCTVKTAAIADLLNNRKDIVLGYRGTGKSAVVRLLMEKRLEFQGEDNFRSTLLCLDEEFDFKLVSASLSRHVHSEAERRLFARIVWEILLIYRALQHLQAHVAESDATIKTYLEELELVLGVAKKTPKLVEVLLTSKKKIGIKFDTNIPSVVDLYAGIEPAASSEPEAHDLVTLRLSDYKRYIHRLLHEHRYTLYVLFDRLDDFVAQEDYETQRLLLHGLLATQQDYRQKYIRVRIKAFIRTDLFRKLDISDFGPDKIVARTISLTWSPSEIKQFVGKRIAINLMQALQLNILQFATNNDHFEISREELARLEETRENMEKSSLWQFDFWKALAWRLKLAFRRRDPSQGRLRNSSDVVNEALITSVFPTEVPHRKWDGTTDTLSIFEYLDSHFQFGHGETTPRAMLSFLRHFLDSTRRYYKENPDIQSVQLQPNGEYPLFIRKAILVAYEAHKQDAWETQLNWAQPWKSLMAVLRRLSLNKRFTFDEFMKAACVSEGEVRQFLAFCTHTGLLRCENDRERWESRQYAFPILFQTQR